MLERHPVENTLALTVLDHALAGNSYPGDAMLFGWHDDGGAVCMAPPLELLLAIVPQPLLASVVAALRKHAKAIPGVNGDVSAVDSFADAGVAGTSVRAVTVRASAAVVAVATEWVQAFQVEAGMHPVGSESLVRDRIADGRLLRWQDDDGASVSLAARQRTVAGVSRIGPVYPPPACRRHGFGAAVTCACTADALARDAKHVVLFTDLANPTSNAIYQENGYRPIADREVVRFLP